MSLQAPKGKGSSVGISLVSAGGAFAIELGKLLMLLALPHNPTDIDPQGLRWLFDVAESFGAAAGWRVLVSLHFGSPPRLLNWIASVVVATFVLATGTTIDLIFDHWLPDPSGLTKAVSQALALGIACALLANPMLWLLRASETATHASEDPVDGSEDRMLIAGFAGALVYFISLVSLAALGYDGARAQTDPLREMVGIAHHQQLLSQQLFTLGITAQTGELREKLQQSATQIEEDGARLDRLYQESELRIPYLISADANMDMVRQLRMAVADDARSVIALHEKGSRAASEQGMTGVLRNDVSRIVPAIDLAIARIEAVVKHVETETLKESEIAIGSILAFVLALLFGVALPAARILRHLTLVARFTHNPVLICNRERRIVWANQAFARLSGYSLQESIGRTPGELRQCMDTDRTTIARMREALNAGTGIRTEILNKSKQGQRQWIDVDIRPVRDGKGRLRGFVGIETDITRRVHLNQYLKAVLDTAGAAIVVQDASGAIIDCNVEAERLFGRVREQMIGKAFGADGWAFLHEDGSALPPSEIPSARCLQTRESVRNVLLGIENKDRSRRWMQVNAQIMVDGERGVTSVVSSFTDITSRREMESRLHVEARTDKLTGLANRVMFTEWLSSAIARWRENNDLRFAILLVDFDRFKLINDSLGHDAGDTLLRQMGERLRNALRDHQVQDSSRHGDEIARLGGDEFAALVNDVRSTQDAERVADRLLQAITAPYEIKGNRLHLSASVGVFVSDDRVGTAEEALRNADTAMYEAKRAGGGRKIVFEGQMQVRVARRLSIENALREALPGGELHLVYQPIVDLENGRTKAVEVLLRWNSAVLGQVSPAEFVPVAEESGLIVPVGEWVLRQACRQMALWHKENPALAPSVISVNVSRVQLNDANALLALIREALAESGLSPSALQVEITEREIMKDVDSVRAMIADLRQIGVKLAMDDFGTGASSLGCLCDLRFDVVKIDRSFVAELETKPELLAVAHASVLMLRNLGLVSVAEGVETGAQLATLQAIGCHYGQGYLFGRPVRAEELLDSAGRLSLNKAADIAPNSCSGFPTRCTGCLDKTCGLARHAPVAST